MGQRALQSITGALAAGEGRLTFNFPGLGCSGRLPALAPLLAPVMPIHPSMVPILQTVEL